MSELKTDDTIWQQLMPYRVVTERTGIIHDAQKYQLSWWGKILFDGYAEEIEIGATLPWTENEGAPNEVHHDDRAIEYRLTVGGGSVKVRQLSPGVTNKLEGLARSVKDLLGDRFTTRVSVNGAVIFESKGKSRDDRADH